MLRYRLTQHLLYATFINIHYIIINNHIKCSVNSVRTWEGLWQVCYPVHALLYSTNTPAIIFPSTLPVVFASAFAFERIVSSIFAFDECEYLPASSHP